MASLLIDTSNSEQIFIILEKDGKKFKVSEVSKILKAQALLPLIDKTLEKHKLSLSDLAEIKVNPGPGSFTGLRVGAAVANALGWLLGVPVNGQDVRKKPLEPVYK